ncbi:pyridine nucleotide-disulfide oxidoreductase domain-containing protein 2-like isoform X1 [Apostichopus japonicus]|uniref:pyridine nucleotide-disulfide oxidoreductase domain-containing protein 2-like isoform X1 n=2 Tax=Stichopus japonicus TaxID=307972 RepID=UPI003AB1FE92
MASLGNKIRTVKSLGKPYWYLRLPWLQQCRPASGGDPLTKDYDVIIVGAGHNGLVASAYLQMAGLQTLVLERRHIIGGAAVTEEIIPGYKFSRCSYVLSLLRPHIYKDLELKKRGLKVYTRPHFAFTPLLEEPGQNGRPRSLLLGKDHESTYQQIAKFSKKDAEAFPEYEKYIAKLGEAIEPLLDMSPVDIQTLTEGTLRKRLKALPALKTLTQTGLALGKDIPTFYEILTAPAKKILDRWFESEPLKATIATDSVIGAMLTPDQPGSGYVLLHHVMGQIDGEKGAWGFAEGGMGSVSRCISEAALEHGATILTNKTVSSLLSDSDKKVCGVVLEDGTEIRSKAVLSNATPKVTFVDLLPTGLIPAELVQDLKGFDSTSPVTKINVAVNKLPNFTALPNVSENVPGPHHSCTIHLNCESMNMINEAYSSAMAGELPKRPMIELCIPSTVDPTLAPEGHHVLSFFTQYTPYHLSNGREWDEETKKAYADIVFDAVEQYAPGFKDSIVGADILPPPELERIFGLTGGNIFHGALSLDQLYLARPYTWCSSYRTPVKGLYLCGSGAHPGGGVMGAPGYNSAQIVKTDFAAM